MNHGISSFLHVRTYSARPLRSLTGTIAVQCRHYLLHGMCKFGKKGACRFDHPPICPEFALHRTCATSTQEGEAGVGCGAGVGNAGRREAKGNKQSHVNPGGSKGGGKERGGKGGGEGGNKWGGGKGGEEKRQSIGRFPFSKNSPRGNGGDSSCPFLHPAGMLGRANCPSWMVSETGDDGSGNSGGAGGAEGRCVLYEADKETCPFYHPHIASLRALRIGTHDTTHCMAGKAQQAVLETGGGDRSERTERTVQPERKRNGRKGRKSVTISKRDATTTAKAAKVVKAAKAIKAAKAVRAVKTVKTVTTEKAAYIGRNGKRGGKGGKGGNGGRGSKDGRSGGKGGKGGGILIY